MQPERLYLDTSVINVYRDARDVFLQAQTRLFWSRLSRFQAYVSDVVIGEIERAPHCIRDELKALVGDLPILALSVEAESLAERYVQEGVFTPRDLNDALHVAVATVAGLDYLVSWNFRHLVKVKTRRLVNLINVVEGYRTVEIIAPSEL
jgi:predicted nucleic acid-binding protein